MASGELWEYKHHTINFNTFDLEQRLNESGQEGWEFAALFVAGDNVHVVMKRAQSRP